MVTRDVRRRSGREGGRDLLYELREYTVVPGKLPALIARFNDHTLGLFEQHGFRVEFLSQTEFGENSIGEVVYVLRWESYQEMADAWARFMADPEWQKVKKESERDGPINAAVRRRLLNSAPFDARLAGARRSG